MSNRSIGLSEALHDYLLAEGVRETPLQRRLREETATLPSSNMQIAPEEGALLAMLVKLTGTRRAIEIGTFTGYSALAMALALPEDGQLIACDVNTRWTQIATRYWEEAGVADRIDLRIAPAADTLDRLIETGERGCFDLVFIDADKSAYERYYDRAIELLRPGGLVAVDNTLWNGRVIDPDASDNDTAAIRAFNHRLRTDERVDLCLLPVADGVTLARKR
jgi:predicted O-methyltransferase YrrM